MTQGPHSLTRDNYGGEVDVREDGRWVLLASVAEMAVV